MVVFLFLRLSLLVAETMEGLGEWRSWGFGRCPSGIRC